jgi:hypothetical protein
MKRWVPLIDGQPDYSQGSFAIEQSFPCVEVTGAQIQVYRDETSAQDMQPDWESALIAIHTGLASGAVDCPFCQLDDWADSDAALAGLVLRFTLAFQQPAIVRKGAVEGAMLKLWNALSTQQQSDLNSTAIESWDTAHNLGLAMPWA